MGHKQYAEGKGFESAFRVMANLCGLKVLKVPEMGRWMGPQAFKPIPGWSDFMLVSQTGHTAFVDCKTTIETSFSYSKINQDQVAFFQQVGDLCPAGYIINFVPFSMIVFIDWRKLQEVRPGESLSPADGLDLGRVPNIKVNDIFKHITRDAVA